MCICYIPYSCFYIANSIHICFYNTSLQHFCMTLPYLLLCFLLFHLCSIIFKSSCRSLYFIMMLSSTGAHAFFLSLMIPFWLFYLILSLVLLSRCCSAIFCIGTICVNVVYGLCVLLIWPGGQLIICY